MVDPANHFMGAVSAPHFQPSILLSCGITYDQPVKRGSRRRRLRASGPIIVRPPSCDTCDNNDGTSATVTTHEQGSGVIPRVSFTTQCGHPGFLFTELFLTGSGKKLAPHRWLLYTSSKFSSFPDDSSSSRSPGLSEEDVYSVEL